MIFLLPVFVFSFFPPVALPTLNASYMNWGIAMYGGIVVFATVYYLIWGRHSYISPRESVKEVAEAVQRFSNHEKNKIMTAQEHEIEFKTQ
jgi:hypothetical protein